VLRQKPRRTLGVLPSPLFVPACRNLEGARRNRHGMFATAQYVAIRAPFFGSP
jgi:hypothetical protein